MQARVVELIDKIWRDSVDCKFELFGGLGLIDTAGREGLSVCGVGNEDERSSSAPMGDPACAIKSTGWFAYGKSSDCCRQCEVDRQTVPGGQRA